MIIDIINYINSRAEDYFENKIPDFRAAFSVTFAASALSLSGCSQSMSDQKIYTTPLARWRSVPSIKGEEFQISSEKTISIPKTNGIFKTPYGTKNSNLVNLYFNLDQNTMTLIEPSKVGEYRDALLIEMNFSGNFDNTAAAYDINIHGRSVRSGMGLLSPKYEISISGDGHVLEHDYHYRCSIPAHRHDDPPWTVLSCNIIIPGNIAKVLSIQMGLPRTADGKINAAMVEKLNRASQEAIKIEKSFVVGD